MNGNVNNSTLSGPYSPHTDRRVNGCIVYVARGGEDYERVEARKQCIGSQEVRGRSQWPFSYIYLG